MSRLEKYIDTTLSGLNTNDINAKTVYVDISGCEELMFYVEGKTGQHQNHEVCLEVSPDGTIDGGEYSDDGGLVKVDGVGNRHVHDSVVLTHVRFGVKLAEGSISTCDIHVQGFRKIG